MRFENAISVVREAVESQVATPPNTQLLVTARPDQPTMVVCHYIRSEDGQHHLSSFAFDVLHEEVELLMLAKFRAETALDEMQPHKRFEMAIVRVAFPEEVPV